MAASGLLVMMSGGLETKALSQMVCVAWANPAAMLFVPCAEASLSDVDRFAAVLRKQVGSGACSRACMPACIPRAMSATHMLFD